MGYAPAGGEAALGAWTLVAALGFVVSAGLLWTWRHTIGHVFSDLAAYHIGNKWTGEIHPLAPLGKINDAVEGELSAWADACQKQAGLGFHYMGELYFAMSKEISQLSQDTLSAGHYIVHTAIPWAIDVNLRPWKKKTNQAAAAAGLAGVELARLKKRSHAQQQTQSHTNATTKAEVHHAVKEAHHAKAVAKVAQTTATDAHRRAVAIPQAAAPSIPFGVTAKQLWRLFRRHEALIGATAFSFAMANVLGLANPRCLRDGPLGRVSRALCGIPTNLLNDLLGLIADFFILENVCTILPWLEVAASDIGTPLVELLTEVGAGLCAGSQAPGRLRGPMPTVPTLIFGVSASGV